MNNNATSIDNLLGTVEDYSNTSIALIKLKSIEKTANFISTLANRIIISIVVALFILITCIACALWIGEISGKSYYGFIIMADLIALLAILFYIFRNRWLKTSFSSSIITAIIHPKNISKQDKD